MKMKLKTLLDESDIEVINGYEVENFYYPGDFNGIAEMTIADGNGTTYEVDQQQEVEMNGDGYAKVVTLAGVTITMWFKVVITITPSFFS